LKDIPGHFSRRKFLRNLALLAVPLAMRSRLSASRLFTAAGAEFMTIGSGLITSEPFSMACRFRPNSLTANQNLMSAANLAAGSAHYLTARGALGGDPAGAQSYAGTGSVEAALSGGSLVVGTQSAIMGVWTSSSSRAVFLDGVKATNSNAVTVSGMDQFNVGRFNSGAAAAVDGELADMAIWNVALSDDDAAAYAKGFSALRIKPQSLIEYWSFVGAGNSEFGVKGNVLTHAAGPLTTRSANHPRIYY
jgi:hypothetical protein